MDSTAFLHCNDIYNAEKSPKFLFQWKKARQEVLDAGRQCFCFFSGDAWSPSIMSTIVRGKQMIPVLNAMSLDVACLGNHDLDLGVHEFEQLKERCNFPWICSNVRHIPSGKKPLGNCQEYVILESKDDAKPFKLLVIGLIENEWIETLATIDADDIEYEEFSVYVKRRVPELVAEHNVDSVVALSHNRMPNDYKLANECGGLIDIVLGGHDHHYEDTIINNIRILNSGTDFSDFTVVNLHGREEHVEGEQLKRVDIPCLCPQPLRTSTKRIRIDANSPEDTEILQELKGIQDLMESTMDTILGTTKVPLDARFSEIRTRETNISNFCAQIMCKGTGADIAILNAGTLRADRIIPKGTLTVRDLSSLLPMADPLEVVALTAERLIIALENGVCKYPAMEGRFPCVDGVRFKFDPSKPPGSRVVEESVFVRDRSTNEFVLLDTNDTTKTYTVVSKAYLISGKDGYEDAFVGAPVVHDEEQSPALPIMFRNLFTELSALKRWQGCTVTGTVIRAATKFKRFVRSSVVDPYAISPEVDGRITNIQEEAKPMTGRRGSVLDLLLNRS